jgi:hypothetical protein
MGFDANTGYYTTGIAWNAIGLRFMSKPAISVQNFGMFSPERVMLSLCHLSGTWLSNKTTLMVSLSRRFKTFCCCERVFFFQNHVSKPFELIEIVRMKRGLDTSDIQVSMANEIYEMPLFKRSFLSRHR